MVDKETKTLQKLLNLFSCSLSEEDLNKRIDEINVINSSFYKEETKSKHTWDAKPKLEKFKPIRRKSLRRIEVLAIELGCSRLRKQLGYQ